VFVAADDDLCSTIKRSSKKLVVVRILADLLRQCGRRANLRTHDDQIENASDIYVGEFICKLRLHPRVFIENLGA
jgi:hypothetical protein